MSHMQTQKKNEPSKNIDMSFKTHIDQQKKINFHHLKSQIELETIKYKFWYKQTPTDK